MSVTVFLHRHQAHRALDLHPLASHFFRLWLWMTTGMVTKEWAAIHRKHHAKCETPEDPRDGRGLFPVYHEPAIANVVAKRHAATHLSDLDDRSQSGEPSAYDNDFGIRHYCTGLP